MKSLGTILLLLALLTDPAKIGKINSLKSEAKSAYLKGDFKTAIQKYKYLVDSLNVVEDEVLLNLANAYFLSNDTTNAVSQYQSLTRSPKNQLRSKAQLQLGVMSNRLGKSEEALTHFKEAIKSDPTNEDARYNYELLKKKLEEKKKEEQKKQDQQNKDQNKQDEKKDQQKDQKEKQDQNKDQENQDQKKEDQKKEQEQKDQQKQDQQKKDQEKQEQEKDQKESKEDKKQDPSVSEKLQQMQMSEEKAKMILEAMKNQEIQYLQQNKRKATKPKDKGKPDW